jgi:uncharacterized coiled-coil DUF342 family protein
MTPEEMAEKLSELEAEKEALLGKVKELKSEKVKLKSKYEDIDPETYSRLVDENESLKTTLEKTQKQYKTDIDKLSADLSNKDKYLQKTILEDGLTKALLENGIDKTYLKPALAMLRSEAEVKQNGEAYEALIGGKALSEFLPTWVNEGDGKLFVLKAPDVGGGSKGGTTEPQKSADKPLSMQEILDDAFSKK